MEIANGLHIKVNQPMTGDLVEHVIKERHASSKLALTGAIEIETHGNLRLQGVTSDFGLPHGILQKRAAKGFQVGGHDTISAHLWLSVKTP